MRSSPIGPGSNSACGIATSSDCSSIRLLNAERGRDWLVGHSSKYLGGLVSASVANTGSDVKSLMINRGRPTISYRRFDLHPILLTERQPSIA